MHTRTLLVTGVLGGAAIAAAPSCSLPNLQPGADAQLAAIGPPSRLDRGVAERVDALIPQAVDAARSAPDARGPQPDARPATPWYAGSFRTLPPIEADLAGFVDALAHPSAGGYGTLGPAREAAFLTFVEVLHDAIDAGRVDGAAADWCAVRASALAASYELFRFRDAGTGRWLLFGRDATGAGQAYLFVNPEARRDLVVEVPHEPFDERTGVQGVRVFRDLAARALLVNQEHRCSDPDESPCDGSGPCAGGTYRESDVAHDTRNTFHALHRWYSDGNAATRFVQLHGMRGGLDDRVEVSDTTTDGDNAASVSVAFAEHLRALVPAPSAVFSCQEPGSPPAGLCATTNVQGRYTNHPTADECTTGAATTTGRFLHLEQHASLRDDDDGDGWSWRPIAAALRETWPACDLGGGALDCALGPPQPDPGPCACGAPCP